MTTAVDLRNRELGDIYHSIMQHRDEAFARYGGNARTILSGPPTLVTFPSLSLMSRGAKEKRVGPVIIHDNQPIFSMCSRILRDAQAPLRILEIGPGRGDLARDLQSQFAGKILEYLAFDRDRSIAGPWTPVTDLERLDEPVDLVIASEVIEHLPADAFVKSMLDPIARSLRRGGHFIVSLPNATSPGGMVRDFTHVQAYPWYDLYAIFRLCFTEVRVFRSTYLWRPERAITLLPRMMICIILEQEWAEGLICVAKQSS